MKSKCAVLLAALVTVFVVSGTPPVHADEETVDATVPVLILVSIVNVPFTLANAVFWTRDGSVETGIIGMVFGASAIALAAASVDDTGEEWAAAFMSAGFLGVVTGTGALVRGLHTRDANRVHAYLAPSVTRSRGETSVGLQLIARW